MSELRYCHLLIDGSRDGGDDDDAAKERLKN